MDMKTTVIPQNNVRAWYGLSAEIVVEHGLWHLVRVGRVALYHPPLVNLLLRRGQPRRERLRLSFIHEFGHLQTLPVAVIHLLYLMVYGRWRGRGFWGTLTAVFAATVAHQATWELASETYVVANTGSEYGRIYREHPNPLGQTLFWGGMSILSLLLTHWVLMMARNKVFQK